MARPVVFDGGFADPVFDGQAAFRSAMDAMAHPGRIVEPGGGASGPSPLHRAAAAFLAVLADYDTPVWFEDEGADEAAAWLAFHTGAVRVFDPREAVFAVLAPASPVESWSAFPVGTSSYPDASATLILPVTSLRGGERLTLQGPGIATVASVSPQGLPADFFAALAANRARFPLGFDLLLVCDTEFVALPRSTRIGKG